MKLSLFNTLTRKREVFVPINKHLVKMYVCGPTVYDRPHIGNARSVVVYDVLYRLLMKMFGKEKVIYVRNITDIDDKIINRASEENIAINTLTKKTIKYFHEDMDYLGCLKPTFEPRATDHVEDMINIINRLLSKGVAYKARNHVYFDITKFQDYAKLSGQSLDQLLGSVRKDVSEGKKNLADFVLWKPAKQDEGKSAVFDSPFGPGRPGWHIECSAMSHKFLGETFDIHGGGVDLIFPHHTNEIAQSCSAFSSSEYAKVWVHNGFLTVNHEKMSKSLGNFLTVQDLIKAGIKGDVARLFLLSSHYRKPLDYNDKAIKDFNHMITYWYRAIEGIEYKGTGELPLEFINTLLDDLNTYKAIKTINDFAKLIHLSKNLKIKEEYSTKLISCARFLGLMREPVSDWFRSDVGAIQIEELITKRKQAKEAKDWTSADKIRQGLYERGIVLEDKPDGTTTWKRIV
ncbi:MAG: cysteine--tRNA ligase [Rickettsiaceae bacterium]